MKSASRFSTSPLLLITTMMMIMMAMMQPSAAISRNPSIPPMEYGGKLYYVHKAMYTSIALAYIECNDDLARVLEFNDEPEYNAIHDYLKNTVAQHGIQDVIFGVTYNFKYKKDWELLSFGHRRPQYMPPTAQNFHQHPKHDNLMCLALSKKYDWQVLNFPCRGLTFPQYAFICEKKIN